MMKYVFVLVLLGLGGVASVLGANIVYRWTHNMTDSPRIMPGERAFPMAPGSIPRGGELTLPREERDAAALRRNPVAATPASSSSIREASAGVSPRAATSTSSDQPPPGLISGRSGSAARIVSRLRSSSAVHSATCACGPRSTASAARRATETVPVVL